MDFRGTMAEFEVIGVAKDVRFASLTRIDPAHVYLPPKPGDFADGADAHARRCAAGAGRRPRGGARRSMAICCPVSR